MRALLVWPPSPGSPVLGWADLGAVAEPLALEYVGAVLRRRGWEVRLLDLRLHPGGLEAALRAFEPDLVAVTAYSMHVHAALKVCRAARARRSCCRTVVGGHHARFLPEDFFDPAVDFIVQGEATEPLAAIAEALEQGAMPEPAPGLWCRSADGRYRSGGAPPAVTPAALDAMPFPDRSLTRGDRHRYFIDWMKPVALLRTSIGCPYRCSFCSIWRAMEGRYHYREPDAVVDELRQIEEPWVFLVDDEAFINRRRMLMLAEAIARAGIRRKFFTYCRIDTLLRNREAIAAWKEIGLERLFIGIDGVTEGELARYNKGCDIPSIEEGLALARALGIEVFAQFVIDPLATERDFRRLEQFIEHHRIRYPSFTVLTPLPGTPLLENFDAVTMKRPDGRPDWDLFDCQQAVTATAMPRERFQRRFRQLYETFKGAYLQHREGELLFMRELRTA